MSLIFFLKKSDKNKQKNNIVSLNKWQVGMTGSRTGNGTIGPAPTKTAAHQAEKVRNRCPQAEKGRNRTGPVPIVLEFIRCIVSNRYCIGTELVNRDNNSFFKKNNNNLN